MSENVCTPAAESGLWLWIALVPMVVLACVLALAIYRQSSYRRMSEKLYWSWTISAEDSVRIGMRQGNWTIYPGHGADTGKLSWSGPIASPVTTSNKPPASMN